jgi:hypothetical protein
MQGPLELSRDSLVETIAATIIRIALAEFRFVLPVGGLEHSHC